MAFKTKPIPVMNGRMFATQFVTLIVSTQAIADSFNNSYLQWNGNDKNHLVYGGEFIDGVRRTPASGFRSKAMTLRVGAPYMSRRNTTWDDRANNIFDYRTAVFGELGHIPKPVFTFDIEKAVAKVGKHPEVAYLENIIGTYGNIQHASRTHTYNNDGLVDTITLTYKVKRK